MSNNSRFVKSILATIALIAVFLTGSVPVAHALVGPLTAGSSFNSSFNGSHTGWSAVSGPWKQNATNVSTVGIPDFASSIKHSGTYGNFIYTVRMKRASSSLGTLNWLYVRGNPSSLLSGDLWGTGYMFGYIPSGARFVIKFVGGSLVGSSVAATPAVITGANYNVLKVLAYGNVLIFYINGTRVFALEDGTPISNGYVGVGMIRDTSTTGDKLFVDYAKLSKIVGDPGPLPNVNFDTLGAPQIGTDLLHLP